MASGLADCGHAAEHGAAVDAGTPPPPARALRYRWSALNSQQVGAYTEYFVKMELTMCGFQVYTTEVDDRGVDFVARHGGGPFLEVQVKSLRAKPGAGGGYVFMPKSKFALGEHRYLAFGLLRDGSPPDLFFIPSTVWSAPDACFVSRDYGEGRKSEPEWGLGIARKHAPALDRYRFENTVGRLLHG